MQHADHGIGLSAAPAIEGHTVFEEAQALFAGAAFLLHYATGVSLGKLFFAINIPFYLFAWRRMGREFTLKTFIAISLLSLMTDWSPRLFAIDRLDPAYAAVLGGLLLGSGCLFLAIDCSIVLAALTVVEPVRVGYSVLGAVVMNLFIAVNHKPGRYAVL